MKEVTKNIINRIEELEAQLDSWNFYKNPKGLEDLKKELDQLYAQLPEG